MTEGGSSSKHGKKQSAGVAVLDQLQSKDLEALPRWAKIALIARIAKHFLYVITTTLGPKFDTDVQRFKKVVSTLERIARDAKWRDSALCIGATDADMWSRQHRMQMTELALDGIRYAAWAAQRSKDNHSHMFLLELVFRAQHLRCFEVNNDYKRLVTFINQHKCDNTTPISSAVFGPMRPEKLLCPPWTAEKYHAQMIGYEGALPQCAAWPIWSDNMSTVTHEDFRRGAVHERASVPTSLQELEATPQLALVAYIARCAKRVLPYAAPPPPLIAEYSSVLDAAVEAAERYASGGSARTLTEHANRVHSFTQHWPDPVARTVIAAIYAALCVANKSYHTAAHAYQGSSFAAQIGSSDRILLAMRRDFEVLASAAKAHGWDNSTPVSKTLFGEMWPGTSVGMIFFPRVLLEYFAREPDMLRTLSPQQFEELVADRLSCMGLEVRLVGNTNRRDGGIDIVAWPSGPSPFPYLLAAQVKHHNTNRPTGASEIRDFYGAVTSGGTCFNFGLVVTNTHFTADARWFADRNRQIIRLRDLWHLCRWMRDDLSESIPIRELPDQIELAPGITVKLGDNNLWTPP